LRRHGRDWKSSSENWEQNERTRQRKTRQARTPAACRRSQADEEGEEGKGEMTLHLSFGVNLGAVASAVIAIIAVAFAYLVCKKSKKGAK